MFLVEGNAIQCPLDPPFTLSWSFTFHSLLTWFFVSPHLCACGHTLVLPRTSVGSAVSPRACGPEQHQVAKDNHALTASSLEAVLSSTCASAHAGDLAPTLACLLSADRHVLRQFSEVVKRQMSREKARWCLLIQCHLGSVLWLRP